MEREESEVSPVRKRAKTMGVASSLSSSSSVDGNDRSALHVSLRPDDNVDDDMDRWLEVEAETMGVSPSQQASSSMTSLAHVERERNAPRKPTSSSVEEDDEEGGGVGGRGNGGDLDVDFVEEDEDEFGLDGLHVHSTMNLDAEDQVRHAWGWKRQQLEKPIDPSTDTIIFQQLELTQAIEEFRPGFPEAVGPNHDISDGKRAVLRFWGVTREGHSVLARVHGYRPYFYIQAPAEFRPEHVDGMIREINSRAKSGERLVTSIEFAQKQSLMFYHFGQLEPFLRIYTVLPSHVPTTRGILERGITIPGLREQAFLTYESDVLFVLRFMIDMQVVGANWIELPAGKYSIREESQEYKNWLELSDIQRSNRLPPKCDKSSYCQIEVDVWYENFISHLPNEERWSRMAPFRILSFDIECAGRKGHFPDPAYDPVIQIANYVTEQGNDRPFVKNVFTLGTCSNIPGADVHSFATEHELLLAWREFVLKVDVDLFTGYNIMKFDFDYLLRRAEQLRLKDFPLFSRLKAIPVRLRDATFSSRAYGTRESKELHCDGRIFLDVLQAMQRDYKLSSYSLNSVSSEFLGEQKEDVHYSIINDLQNGDAETRHRLAVYCLKDAYLPQRLLDKLLLVVNYIEMARVTGVPLSYLLARGQQIKVLSQLLRRASEDHLLMPRLQNKHMEEGYEGATVIEPRRGFYDIPIATLDFASLYPSIMMAHNLCYTTLIRPSDRDRIPREDVVVTPNGDMFVSSSRQQGLLPRVLQELLSARKQAKREMESTNDPFLKQVLDGRQKALKVSANSVYGFTGASTSKLPCLEISSGVTSFGRQMIDQTKKMVEERYTVKNGYAHDAVVVYGDTDSVMVRFGTSSMEESMRLGQEAAAYVSSSFIKPIKLEFEKCYSPYLLINKKRYAGLLWTRPEKHDKMDFKGIETVRRDNCALVRVVLNTVLQKILIEKSVSGAIAYVKQTISDLLVNNIDLSMLVVTKALSAKADEYKAKQAHVCLAERMQKRDPATAPQIGDRVPYVIIKGAPGAKAYEKAEDPIYVLENSLPIDTNHYLEHQLMNPLRRIFEPIMDNPDSLFRGEHTRKISLTAPKVGGIMKFAERRATCLGCKAVLPSDDMSLCEHCKPREAELYSSILDRVNQKEELFSRLWTQCQRCQGSLHQDVLCTNRDCPIFYMRKKVQKDLHDQQALLQRFEW